MTRRRRSRRDDRNAAEPRRVSRRTRNHTLRVVVHRPSSIVALDVSRESEDSRRNLCRCRRCRSVRVDVPRQHLVHHRRQVGEHHVRARGGGGEAAQPDARPELHHARVREVERERSVCRADSRLIRVIATARGDGSLDQPGEHLRAFPDAAEARGGGDGVILVEKVRVDEVLVIVIIPSSFSPPPPDASAPSAPPPLTSRRVIRSCTSRNANTSVARRSDIGVVRGSGAARAAFSVRLLQNASLASLLFLRFFISHRDVLCSSPSTFHSHRAVVTRDRPPVDMASSDETPTTYLKDYAPFPYDVEKVRAPATRNANDLRSCAFRASIRPSVPNVCGNHLAIDADLTRRPRHHARFPAPTAARVFEKR